MLKHRQNGLVGLHGTILLMLVTVTFLAARGLVESFGWIRFNLTVNWSLYFVGVIGAMAWIHYSLRGAGEKLGALSLGEALRLTAQQIVRLMVILFALAFVTKDVEVSRAFLVGFLGSASLVLFAANFLLARYLAAAFFRHQRLRTVIAASPAEAGLLQAWLTPRAYLGIDVLGYVTPAGVAADADPRCLGTVLELQALIASLAADQVVFSRDDFSRDDIPEVIRAAEQAHCRVRFFANLHSFFGAAPGCVEHTDQYVFATSTMEPLENPLNRVVKRALDVAVALPVVLFVLPPLTLVVWLMQRWQSPGAVFYDQLRSGLNRERFSIYKFRTMHVDDGRSTPQQATQGDARVYPFGRFLRRSSLDEMPQFLNVLMSTMSVSGPRPHLLEHDVQFGRLEHAYCKRNFVKPGITGLAQSMGFRGELRASGDLANRVRYDELYVANWSLGLDLSILFRTLRQIILPPRSAY